MERITFVEYLSVTRLIGNVVSHAARLFRSISKLAWGQKQKIRIPTPTLVNEESTIVEAGVTGGELAEYVAVTEATRLLEGVGVKVRTSSNKHSRTEGEERKKIQQKMSKKSTGPELMRKAEVGGKALGRAISEQIMSVPGILFMEVDVQAVGGDISNGKKQDIEVTFHKDTKSEARQKMLISLKSYWDSSSPSVSLITASLGTMLAYVLGDAVKAIPNSKGNLQVDIDDFAKQYPELKTRIYKEYKEFLDMPGWRQNKETYAEFKERADDAQRLVFSFIVDAMELAYKKNKKQFRTGLLKQYQLDNPELIQMWAFTHKKQDKVRVANSLANEGFRELISSLGEEFDVSFERGKGTAMTLQIVLTLQGKEVARIKAHQDRKAIQQFLKVNFDF